MGGDQSKRVLLPDQIDFLILTPTLTLPPSRERESSVYIPSPFIGKDGTGVNTEN